MPKRSSKKKDVNQIAYEGLKSLVEYLDPESVPEAKEKNPAAVALGKLGGIAQVLAAKGSAEKEAAKK